MPKLTPEKPREVIRKLKALGFEGPFGGDKHVFMRHPEIRIKVSIPVHQGRDIPVGALRAILRQTGVDIEKWLSV